MVWFSRRCPTRTGGVATGRHCTVFALALLALACGPGPPPSVVLVTLDTTRPDHLSTYGYARETSPNLTLLAREAVRFTRAWSTSPWTLPAHASIFTGLAPSAHGAHSDLQAPQTLADAIHAPFANRSAAGKLDDHFTTLSELLAAHGYRTGAFVAGPWLKRPFGLMQGFGTVDDDVVDVVGRRADAVTDGALAWLAGLARSEPFFLFVNYFDPHWPYTPPSSAGHFPGERKDYEPGPIIQSLLDGSLSLDARERAIWIARYDAEIRFMDAQLGRLLDAVRARPNGERTLIVVTSDHGEAFGEGGRYFHTYWLSQELLHVPLLVRYPNAAGGGRVDESPMQLTDVLPLVATELGLELPAAITGLPRGEREYAFADLYRNGLAISISPERFDRRLEAAIRWPFKLVRSDRGARELTRLGGAAERPAEDAAQSDQLAARLNARSKATSPAEVVHPEVDMETERALRELGYVE
jgi:arylsulfatase